MRATLILFATTMLFVLASPLGAFAQAPASLPNGNSLSQAPPVDIVMSPRIAGIADRLVRLAGGLRAALYDHFVLPSAGGHRVPQSRVAATELATVPPAGRRADPR